MTKFTAPAFVIRTCYLIAIANHLFQNYHLNYILPGTVYPPALLQNYLVKAGSMLGGISTLMLSILLLQLKFSDFISSSKMTILEEDEAIKICERCTDKVKEEGIALIDEFCIDTTEVLLDSKTGALKQKVVYIADFLLLKYSNGSGTV